MRRTAVIIACSIVFMFGASSAGAETTSPWTGSWRIDLGRSSPAARQGVPTVYRFTLGPSGDIRWEIPELGEVVTGKTDGRPMPIKRTTEATAGLTLSVQASGPRELTYQVARFGKSLGGGRMLLVDDATSWVDLSWAEEGPGYGVELVYTKVRPPI